MADQGEKKENPMRELRIRKLCLNICVGESGDRLTRAAKVLEFNTQMQLYSNTDVIRSQVNVYMEYCTMASKAAQPIIKSGTIHIITDILLIFNLCLLKQGRIGAKHRICKEEAMRWFQQKVFK
uniref:Large ribosomal subunit protein uL5 N-terminal domain-containing protein n=1 Tax=Sinocyclocheilus rhinocerous TaxID=307959 RepID=A0A673LBE1_9TELE